MRVHTTMDVHYAVLLSAGEAVHWDPIGFSPASDLRVSSFTHDSEHVAVVLTGEQVLRRDRTGLRLDLRPRDTRTRRNGRPDDRAVAERYLSELTSSPPPNMS
ncbi:hypothetical protein [Umezawaea beigongshangensis]|uniref:hypothetical protein n=1 Tax=Umezawaea beigongshangensis TaxID=2780383 RepID=UPI0018F1D5FC|nr:hypothetical protein [Umezawaea beigongshangensis]